MRVKAREARVIAEIVTLVVNKREEGKRLMTDLDKHKEVKVILQDGINGPGSVLGNKYKKAMVVLQEGIKEGMGLQGIYIWICIYIYIYITHIHTHIHIFSLFFL